jgi:hypothetical protein
VKSVHWEPESPTFAPVSTRVSDMHLNRATT